jgi:pSer/pThr/pTyr-binding forkhead associated (FHA) protein
LENQGRYVRFLFNKPRTLIGSADDNDIVIRDATLLPRHAEFFVAGTELHLVAVAGGRTEVNGYALTGVHVLRNGDEIRFGGVEVLFAREARMSDNTLNLIVERAGDIPFGITIAKPVIRLGRSKGDILFDDDGLLATHVLIENFCPNGVYVLAVKPQATTYLNGEVLDGRRRLHDGDALRFGSTIVQVAYAEEAGQSARAPEGPTLAAQSYAPPPSPSRYAPERAVGRAPAEPAQSPQRDAPAARPAPRPVQAPANASLSSGAAGHAAASTGGRNQPRPTSMVDASEIRQQVAQMPPPVTYVPAGVFGGGGSQDPYTFAAAPDEADPLPAFPDTAHAGDFVGARHYLPKNYRAGRTQESSPEANWSAGQEPQARKRGSSVQNATTAIPHPARLKAAVEHERDSGGNASMWYHPDGEPKREE